MRRVRVVPRHPFVTRLPTDRIPLGELGHRPLVTQPVGDKRHALIHGAGLRPGHPASLAGPRRDLSPMYPVYSVTYLSGSDLTSDHRLPPPDLRCFSTTLRPP